MLGCKESIRLLDFYECSFIGEFEVIFKTPAERSYVAVNKKMVADVSTQVYFCKPEDFNAILYDFDDFDTFVRTRSIRRRAYIRYLEKEFESELKLLEESDHNGDLSVDLTAQEEMFELLIPAEQRATLKIESRSKTLSKTLS